MPLTPAQYPTLKTNVLANTATVNYNGVSTQIKDVPNNGDGNDAVAKWYNLAASPDFFVWRDLPMDRVLGLITPANMTPLDAVPAVTTLPASPTAAQNATYSNQIGTLHIWNARATACMGKQLNYQNLTVSRTVAPMKVTAYRAALQDCLTNIPAGASGALLSANWVGVRDDAKGRATNAEKLFATGTGSFATPADLVAEGGISPSDVNTALNLP